MEQYSKRGIKIYKNRKTAVIDRDGNTNLAATLTNDKRIFAIHVLFRAHGIYFGIERSIEANADDV